MTQSRKQILVISLALALILLGALLAHACRLAQLAATQRKMHDPAYRAAQTVKLQPSVARELTEHFPHATITPHPSATGNDNVFEVHLPPDDGRKLPLVYAEMNRVCAKFRQQGYQGTLLLYDKGQIIKSVSSR